MTGAGGDHVAPALPARPPFLAICDYAEPGYRFPHLHTLPRGAAVIDCWRAVSSTVRNAQRRDGLNPPARLIMLERGLAKEAQLAAASGRPDVRDGTFLPPFPQNVEVIDATEAGRLLGLSSCQVRLGASSVVERWRVAGCSTQWPWPPQAVVRKRAA
jgi:hypothetical protein